MATIADAARLAQVQNTARRKRTAPTPENNLFFFTAESIVRRAETTASELDRVVTKKV